MIRPGLWLDIKSWTDSFRWTQMNPVTENNTLRARAGLDNRARQIPWLLHK